MEQFCINFENYYICDILDTINIINDERKYKDEKEAVISTFCSCDREIPIYTNSSWQSDDLRHSHLASFQRHN